MRKKDTSHKGNSSTGKKTHAFTRFEKEQTQDYPKPSKAKKERRKQTKKAQKEGFRRKTNAYPYPLNKYLAHCGVCARRKAVEHIKEGQVKVNNKTILEPGFKVERKDKVYFNNKPIRIQQRLEYLLLNKPKDCLTTTNDPRGRRTVMDYIRHASQERVYPVGRLDRNTSGLLLITNDGDLAQHLSHPSGEIEKIYHATLNKPLTQKDFDQIISGLELEDGFIAPDAIAFPNNTDHTQVGIEIHSGRNRIVRRIFEQLGYEVKNLDRVVYAGLTKKNLTRGKWRSLTEKEVRTLKHFNKSKKKTPQKRK
ncbi:MAG TPA: pseudouridine synthase [Chitinophagaceae bacterium]|nr:pseudouridine synthase [Chitinophagaceae bacterium]